MRSRWSPSALQSIDTCPRRFALREAGWAPKPNLFKPAAPHTDFGRVWHAAAEEFDRQIFGGSTHELATEDAMSLAMSASWNHGAQAPFWGLAVDQWRCDGGTVPSEKTGRPVQCPASKGWWVWNTRLVIHGGTNEDVRCPKCNGQIIERHAYLPHHATKNRAMLLRAVLDYCDEALPGVERVGDAPGLEMELEFRLAGIELHCTLDRYTSIGPMRFAHERKTSARTPHWDTYFQTYQVRLYPEALHQNGLKCHGVLMEHYQIQSGGTRRSTVTLTPGPDHIAEAAERIVEHANLAEAYDGREPLDWPGRFSACAHAAGGMPCEFLKVCKAARARRPELLAAEFEQRERT